MWSEVTCASFRFRFGTCRLLQFWTDGALLVPGLMWMDLPQSVIDLGACGFGGPAGPQSLFSMS